MHPLLTSPGRLALYLASWSLIALLLAVGYAATASSGWMGTLIVLAPPWLLYAFVCLSAWYVCRAAPLRAAGASRVLIAHLGSGILAAALWVVVWEVWTQILAGFPRFGTGIVETYRSLLPLVLAAGLLLYWLSGMFHYLLIAFETSRQAETRQLGLEVLAREAELKALRAQIDPHFLFNSLHSVSALTHADPEGARRMCVLLADFFRSSVRLGAKDQIRLEEEIEMVRQYLEIEKVRFGDRLVSDLDMQAESATCLVPPLILQPLVENSVRHGIHARVQGGVVRILARRDSGDLHLSIENPVDATTPGHAGTGVGLANVRRRLETRFGNQSSTRVVRPDGLFRVEIRMPCMEDPKGGPTHEPGP